MNVSFRAVDIHEWEDVRDACREQELGLVKETKLDGRLNMKPFNVNALINITGHKRTYHLATPIGPEQQLQRRCAQSVAA